MTPLLGAHLEGYRLGAKKPCEAFERGFLLGKSRSNQLFGRWPVAHGRFFSGLLLSSMLGPQCLGWELAA